MFPSSSTANSICARSVALSGVPPLLSCQLTSIALGAVDVRAKGIGGNRLPFEKLRLGYFGVMVFAV